MANLMCSRKIKCNYDLLRYLLTELNIKLKINVTNNKLNKRIVVYNKIDFNEFPMTSDPLIIKQSVYLC